MGPESIMKSFKRAERVAPLLLEVLAELIAGKVKDPRLKGAVLTRVDIGDDLRLAKVYFQVLEGTPESVEKAFEKARGYLRREMGRRLEMKYTPDLRFRYDRGLDHADKVERILRALRPGEEP